MTVGPTSIRDKERRRTVTIQIRPAPTLVLQDAMEKLETEVIKPLRDSGYRRAFALDFPAQLIN